MKWIIFSVLLGLAFVCQAQKLLQGIVTDESNNEPLVGANIYLLNNWRVGTSTGLEGEFQISIPAKDDLDTLVISFVGYQEKLIPLSGYYGNIKLSPFNDKLDEIVVSATPLIAEEFKYQKINKIEIYTNPSAKADPILAVNSMPSATTADESANISLRGASPVETGVFFNDVPIYDAVRFSQLNGIGTFSIFNTSIVKNLSVFAGNPPLEYGNVTSGLISLATDDRPFERNLNTVNISLANIGYNRSQRINDRSSLVLFANYQPSAFIKGINQESLEAIEEFELGDIGLYFHTALDHLTWKFFNYSITESYDYRFQSPSYNGLFSQSKKRNFSVSKLEYKMGQSVLSLNNGFSISRSNFAYSISDNDLSKTDWFMGINYQLNKEHFHLKAGFSSDNRNQRINGSYPQYYYAMGPEHPFIDYESSSSIRVNEGFVYGKYIFTDQLILGGGIRKHIPDKELSYWSGQANLQYQFNNHWRWVVGAGSYNKHALVENADGTQQIKSRQLSSDIQYESGGSEFSASFFAKDNLYGEDEITFWGVELFWSHQFSDKFKADLSYTYLDQQMNTVADLPGISFYVRNNITWKPFHTWTINSTILYREGTAYLPVNNAIYDQEVEAFVPQYAEGLEVLPDYFSLGLAVSKMFFITEDFNVIAFASANNVTDHSNIRTYTYNEDYSIRGAQLFSRRTVYFGAVINF